jgi:hypothetical protein
MLMQGSRVLSLVSPFQSEISEPNRSLCLEEQPQDVNVWNDNPQDKRSLRGKAPLPIGLQGKNCPQCQSSKLMGAIITETADNADCNIVCLSCGYWWD